MKRYCYIVLLLLFSINFYAQSLKERELLVTFLKQATSMQILVPVWDVIEKFPDIHRCIPSIYPINPEKTRISSYYGTRIDPFTKKRKFHSGIDFAARIATTVHAAADGIIIFSGKKGGYGNTIIISHKFGMQSYYAHLSVRYKFESNVVKKGDVIGFVGSTGRSTGNHLHYEIRINGKAVEPLFLN